MREQIKQHTFAVISVEDTHNPRRILVQETAKQGLLWVGETPVCEVERADVVTGCRD
jgi:hypothetical protein